jgi:hypothetical protein
MAVQIIRPTQLVRSRNRVGFRLLLLVPHPDFFIGLASLAHHTYVGSANEKRHRECNYLDCFGAISTMLKSCQNNPNFIN